MIESKDNFKTIAERVMNKLLLSVWLGWGCSLGRNFLNAFALKIRDTQTFLLWLRFQRWCSARHLAKLATIHLETKIGFRADITCDPA